MQTFTSNLSIINKSYLAGQVDSAYVQLPTGQRAWFAVPIEFSFDKPIYLAGLALYSDLKIHSEEDFVTEYFKPQGDCFAKVCGTVQAVRQTIYGFNKVQLDCNGLLIQLQLAKDVRVTVGDYLELTVLASLSNDEQVVSLE